MARGGRLAQHDQSGLTKEFTAAEGRKFGLTVGLAFVVLGALLLWRSRETPAYVLGVRGGLLVLGGLLIPGSLGPVYRAWMAFALALSKITTPIFMGIIYFLVITPFGIVRRTLGEHPLVHKADAGSYFKRRDPSGHRDLRRQF